MKETDITPEVTELSKRIAEHWRCPVDAGSWVIPDTGFSWVEPLDKDKPHLVVSKSMPPNSYLNLEKYKGNNSPPLPYTPGYFIPIPSIADCEQKLLELGYESMNLLRRPFKLPWMANVWDKESHDLDANTINRWEDKGSSLHEAALSTLLRALRGEESNE